VVQTNSVRANMERPAVNAYRIVRPGAPVLGFLKAGASGGTASDCVGADSVIGRLRLDGYDEGATIVTVNPITKETDYLKPNLLLDGREATVTALQAGKDGKVFTFEWGASYRHPSPASVAVKVQKWTAEAETAIQSLSALARCDFVNFRPWIVMNPMNYTPREPAEVCAPGTCRHKRMCLTVLRP